MKSSLSSDADAAKKHLRPVARQPLEVVRDKLAAIGDWTAENVHLWNSGNR